MSNNDWLRKENSSCAGQDSIICDYPEKIVEFIIPVFQQSIGPSGSCYKFRHEITVICRPPFTLGSGKPGVHQIIHLNEAGRR